MSEIKKKIDLEVSLQPFFFEELSKINQMSAPRLEDYVIFYSSEVLEYYSRSKSFFELNEGRWREKVLGQKLLETNFLSTGQQKMTLKDIADTALMVSGFFHESVNNKILDHQYYERIGTTAYTNLHHLVPVHFDQHDFYLNLAKNFSQISSLLSILSQNILQRDNWQKDNIIGLFLNPSFKKVG